MSTPDDGPSASQSDYKYPQDVLNVFFIVDEAKGINFEPITVENFDDVIAEAIKREISIYHGSLEDRDLTAALSTFSTRYSRTHAIQCAINLGLHDHEIQNVLDAKVATNPEQYSQHPDVQFIRKFFKEHESEMILLQNLYIIDIARRIGIEKNDTNFIHLAYDRFQIEKDRVRSFRENYMSRNQKSLGLTIEKVRQQIHDASTILERVIDDMDIVRFSRSFYDEVCMPTSIMALSDFEPLNERSLRSAVNIIDSKDKYT